MTLPSDSAAWHDVCFLDQSHRERSLLPPDTRAWTRALTIEVDRRGTSVLGSAVSAGDLMFNGATPVRDMSWRMTQKHRPGLEWLASTGRQHGFESLQERRLLVALDFDGRLRDALSQPFQLTYNDAIRRRRHVPDLLAWLDDGQVLLLNVKPADRIEDIHRAAFAACDRLAAARGWRHEVVSGWVEPARTIVETLSSRRRPLHDGFGIEVELRAAAARGPVAFGELVAATRMPVVARAFAVRMLWRKELAVDLASPFEDFSIVRAGRAAS